MSTARCLPLTVLVVDDSDLICERLCALLDESPRLRVVATVRDGADALLTWELLHPAAVVLDIQLPGLGGLELLRRIKSATPQCVVVMLTSFPQEPFREVSRQLGADAFFHKSTEFESVPRYLNALVPEPTTTDAPERKP